MDPRFFSAGLLIAPEGQVVVTLCKGQGGTPSEAVPRRKDDTWKVVEMATYGGFVLRSVTPFDASQYPGYTPVGYRYDIENSSPKALFSVDIGGFEWTCLSNCCCRFF